MDAGKSSRAKDCSPCEAVPEQAKLATVWSE